VLLERMLPWVGSFSGRVVVVTGASSDVGRSTALALAHCGADVALISRRRAGLKTLQDEIRSCGQRALAIRANVSDPDAAREALARVHHSWGKVDMLINNPVDRRSTHPLADDVDDPMRLSLLAATNMTQAALSLLRRQGNGSIVNVAPLAAQSFDGAWGGGLASKFALIGFTETLRDELKESGPALSLVLPDTSSYAMNGHSAVIPPGWVAAATILAAKFGLADISVPPTLATVEALRPMAPLAAEAVSGWVTAAHRLLSATSDDADVSRRAPGELLRLAVH